MKTKTTRTSRYLLSILLLILAICSTGFAITLLDTGTSSLVSSDPKQGLRLSRTNIPSDWSTNKAYPGTTGSDTYHYHTYTIPASALATTPFVQITNSDPDSALFVSTYLGSFNPAHLSTNYLGDAGFSGGYAVLSETGFFQVQVPPGNDLVVVVNDTITGNGGVGAPYRLLVEGFTDSLYTNPSTTPTPPAISIAVTPASMKEGKNATFTFTASPATHAAITVGFQMSGQASNGSDYTLTATNVLMGANQATATVTLKSKVDNLHEGSETAIMTVLPGTGYTVGAPSQATVLIKDN